MELEKSYINNHYHCGYDLYKIKPGKKAELFFEEALERSIRENNLKIGDNIKLVFLYNGTNRCTKFYEIENNMTEIFKTMCDKENFCCIDFNTHSTKSDETKIEIKWVRSGKVCPILR